MDRFCGCRGSGLSLFHFYGKSVNDMIHCCVNAWNRIRVCRGGGLCECAGNEDSGAVVFI